MPTKKPNTGGETGYTRNKTQWFFEEVVLPRVIEDDLSELAQEMYEEMYSRGWSPNSVDWKAVEQGLSTYLAAQAKQIIKKLRDDLNNNV